MSIVATYNFGDPAWATGSMGTNFYSSFFIGAFNKRTSVMTATALGTYVTLPKYQVVVPPKSANPTPKFAQDTWLGVTGDTYAGSGKYAVKFEPSAKMRPNTGKYYFSVRLIVPSSLEPYSYQYSFRIGLATSIESNYGVVFSMGGGGVSGVDAHNGMRYVGEDNNWHSASGSIPTGEFVLDIMIDTDTGATKGWIDNDVVFRGKLTEYSRLNLLDKFCLTVAQRDNSYESPGVVYTVYLKEFAMVHDDGNGWCDRLGPGFYIGSRVPVSDRQTEWTAPSGWTDTHAALMSRPAPIDWSMGLSTQTAGQSESYRMSPIDTSRGHIVAEVASKAAISNLGGVGATIEFTVNGKAVTEFNLPPGSKNRLLSLPLKTDGMSDEDIDKAEYGFRLKEE